MRPASPVRVLAFHGITWSLVAVASVLAAELSLRLSRRVTVESVATASADTFARIPGVFEPGQRVVEQPRPELRHRVSINSLGFRGREPDADEGGRRIRLLCLGDSFTYGSYVDDDQTLPAQLEAALRAAGHPVEVVNAGVGGTTIVDQLYVLAKSAHVAVDLVLLVFSENDIGDLAREEPMHVALERNRALKATPGIRQVYALVRHTALFNLALQVRGWYQAPRPPAARPAAGGAEAGGLERAWHRYDAALGEMHARVAARDIGFAFVIFPSHYRLDARAAGDDRLDRVEALARRRGIRTIPLLPALRAAGSGPAGLYLLPYDGHPSARGYAVAARAIAHELDGDLVRLTASRWSRDEGGADAR